MPKYCSAACDILHIKIEHFYLFCNQMSGLEIATHPLKLCFANSFFNLLTGVEHFIFS